MAIDTTAKRVFIYPSPGNGNYVQKKTAVYNSSEYTFGSPAFYYLFQKQVLTMSQFPR
jgi:hypothetical protein